MQDWTCECSEDYGPCEDHIEVLAQREGSSSRSADELAVVFILDAQSIGCQLSRTLELFLDELEWEGSWIATPEQADELRDYLWQIESDVYTLDTPEGESMFVEWDDGYVIGRMSADCPLLTMV